MRKLTEPDKQEILKLYRESAETTSTLAEKYEVSNSTISRLLKSTLQEDEYEFLVSLKRAARTPEGRAQVSYDNIPTAFVREEIEPAPVPILEPTPEPESKPKPTPRKAKSTTKEPVVVEMPSASEVASESKGGIRRVRKRSLNADEELQTLVPVARQLDLLEQIPEVPSIVSPLLEDMTPQTNAIASMFGEDMLGDDDADDLDDLDDLDDFDDEDDDDEDDDWEAPRPLVNRSRSGDSLVQVLPLSSASLPRTCYLVIDRSAELITRPLRDFGDLGQIPNPETQQRTLPVFDNHRVAKRFSTKRDRVIKVPDSRMLHKARYHLQAKGITRLLIDGQVYSFSNV
ncbi:transposase [Brunnivagina elsteri]|uniref:Transposase n=1 Tax=Brunnivagina elsteri CCALA 953 TaxID=987040 RepID=A0A2A2TJP1_9CYAN|nr:transposase [Calothrix elsteri]PAX55214.1 transposase [Calothrix elsteri CCALA 953]